MKRYWTAERQSDNDRWARKAAVKLLPFLPATIDELVTKTGYAKATVQKLVWSLTNDKIVWGLSAPKSKTVYEKRTNA